jgi:hypothetical protein
LAFVVAGGVYALLFATETARMPGADGHSELQLRKGLGAPMLHLTVRLDGRVCVLDEVLVGDSLLRVGSQCVPKKGEANSERKAN